MKKGVQTLIDKVELIFKEKIKDKGTYAIYINYPTMRLRIVKIDKEKLKDKKEEKYKNYVLFDKNFKNGVYIGFFKSYLEAVGFLLLLKRILEDETSAIWGVNL